MASVYLEPLNPADAAAAPSARLLPLFERVQLGLLYTWTVFALFVPTNLYQATSMVMLGFVWFAALALGAWACAKRPTQRMLALRIMAAYPLVVAVVLTLLQIGFPIEHPAIGGTLFWGGLAAPVIYFAARWITRTTNTTNAPVAVTRTQSFTLLITAVLAVLSLLLVIVLVLDNDAGVSLVLGRDWYEATLMATIFVSIPVGLFALPYSLVGIVRAAGQRARMLAILATLFVMAVCQGGIILVLAIAAAG